MFLIICSPIDFRNFGLYIQEQDFPWDSKEKGLILSSFFWGYIMTQFLGGLFGAKIGGNLVSTVQSINIKRNRQSAVVMSHGRVCVQIEI